MNILRRTQVVAGVVVGTAAVGALSGVVVASALLSMRMGHIHPSFLREVAVLGSQTGAAVGVLLGTPLTFAFLRRVPLFRIATNASSMATYGGIAGYAASLPFSQPRPTIAFMLAGGCLGLAVAAVRSWAQSREARDATAIPAAG